MTPAAPRTVCIVDLGLVGGSLAAALKARVPQRWAVRGVDRRRASLAAAAARGHLDRACASLAEGVDGADLVVLAGPVAAIRAQLAELAAMVRPGQVVTDTGPTKGGILEAAAALPAGVAFVGGHPVAGGEPRGSETPVAGLFATRPCVLTPAAGVPEAALAAVTALWQDAGAEVRVLDAAEHDRGYAALGQLPHLAACALVDAAAACPPAQRALAGDGLRELIGLARLAPGRWRDLCLENRGPLLEALDRYRAALDALRRHLDAAEGPQLAEYFARCRRTEDDPWIP